MSAPKHYKVANPPQERPLMIYDGDCTFCRRWIERWKIWTGDRVDYEESQSVAGRFPEIPVDRYEKAVQLVEINGDVSEGAEAVFLCLKDTPGKGWLYKTYKKWPLFATMAEGAYVIVSRRRKFFSFLTKIFWGKNVEPPTYKFSSWLFPRLLGVLALCAVISYWVQADGLISGKGILPVAPYLETVQTGLAQNGLEKPAFFYLPTLFWLNGSDTAIQWVFASACLAGVALVAGIFTPLAALALWLLYLSLTNVGQAFLTFQWDSLLIEICFLTVFFSPWKIWDRLKVHPEPNSIARWLIWFLLFRLMFESGIVKLQSFGSGDSNTWRDWTALNYHYWSQPLPAWTSFYAHHLPFWFQKFSIQAMFFIELVLPFFILGPRRLRNLAFFGLVLLQILISLTGNYGFFNLLTMLLCLPLIDDQSLPQRLRKRLLEGTQNLKSPSVPRYAKLVFLCLFTLILIPAGTYQLIQSLEDNRKPSFSRKWLKESPSLETVYNGIQPFRFVNSYGLFRVMTTTRPEIQIEGSEDGREWKAYNFRYKPGDPTGKPSFLIPHMPRLDWRMWFEGLNYERSHRFSIWFAKFLPQLFDGNPEVIGLMEENPFPDEPPKYFRLTLSHYTFTDLDTHNETGRWWDVKPLSAYTVSGLVENLKR